MWCLSHTSQVPGVVMSLAFACLQSPLHWYLPILPRDKAPHTAPSLIVARTSVPTCSRLTFRVELESIPATQVSATQVSTARLIVLNMGDWRELGFEIPTLLKLDSISAQREEGERIHLVWKKTCILSPPCSNQLQSLCTLPLSPSPGTEEGRG